MTSSLIDCVAGPRVSSSAPGPSTGLRADAQAFTWEVGIGHLADAAAR